MNSPVQRPELIEDHEVRSSEQDALGHQPVAEQILELIGEVPTPANIALYGPWGSGKTGIANLIEAGMAAGRQRYHRYRFVRFDAFKFAETPLRRNFINAVATGLEVDKAKYHADLYTGVTKTNFSLPKLDIWAAVKVFVLTFLAVCVVLGGLAALVAWAQKGAWHANFTTNLSSFLVAGFPFAALLTGMFALATKAFGREHRTERVDSDEQFEQLFRDLVADSGAQKIVIFVDEIDRCSPKDVVSTLEAIRTFLGVDRCVFVVAADQQVLETALTQSARQATPEDVLNPYYSSGSAYLDKVFQYQVAVPPLPNQSVTQYAVELVENRAGIWRSERRDTIVSVLVPSHVRSPRRVKHLLNSFVIAHRVASNRKASGLLDTWDEVREIELAKLVCLQVEFPIFARSMIEIPRLPEYVLAAATLNEKWADAFPYIKERERKLATEYATGQRAVDMVLADVDETSDDERSTGAVEQAHSLQLVDYLSRTASIPGPQRDLIFMQGLGAPFGLASDVADRIIEASQNDRLSAVEEEITEETADAVLDLVIQELRSAVGVERRNVAAVALKLLAGDRFDLATRADSIVTNLAPALSESPELVDKSTVRGLWRLAAASTLPESDRLAETVLRNRAVQTDPVLAADILREPERVATVSDDVADQLITRHLISPNAAAFIDGLGEFAAAATAQLVDRAPSLPSALAQTWTDSKAAATRLEADEKAAADYAALPSYTQQQRPAPEPTAGANDDAVASLPQTLMTVFDAWCQRLASLQDKAGLQAALRLLMKVDQQDARSLVARYLPASGTWTAAADNDLILKNAIRRLPQFAEPWLRAVDVRRATPASVVETLSNFGRQLWGADEKVAVVSSVGALLGDLLVECSDETRDAVESTILESIDSAVTDDDEATSRIAELDRAAIIVGSGAVRPQSIYRVEANNLASLLKTERDDEDPDGPIVAYVNASLRKLLESWGSPDPIPLLDDLYQAIQDCDWLPEPAATLRRLETQARTNQSEEQPTLEDVLQLIADHTADAAALGAAWLNARPRTASPADIVRLLNQLQIHNAWQVDGVTSAVGRIRNRMSPSERLALVQGLLANRMTLPTKLLSASGFPDLRDDDILDILIARMNQATRNSDRKEVLNLAATRSYSYRPTRSRYVIDLIIPLMPLGLEATNLAIDALVRLGRPITPEMRQQVLVALKPAIEGNERLTRKATEALAPLGFPTRGKGPFGFGGRVLKFD